MLIVRDLFHKNYICLEVVKSGVQSGVKQAIEIRNPETRQVTYKVGFREVISSFRIAHEPYS